MLGWFKRKKTDPKQQIVEALGDQDLPSFPATVLKALSLLRSPTASLRDVGACVSNDPGVGVRILKLTNSAAFGSRHPVRSVEHAVGMLGRVQIESILLSVGVSRAISPATSASGFDGRGFWQSAARRASVARALARRLHPATGAESFTAALLSDMAVPLIANAKGTSYGSMLRQASEDGGALHSLERSEFGWDHGSVGGALCLDWRFPETLSDAIGAHHEALNDETIPPAVRLASLLGDAEGDGDDELVEEAASRFGLPTDHAVEALAQAAQSAASIASSFG